MSTLYVVATPIGNLEDITLRALRLLKEVDLVVCEDTRVTRKLLSHFDIHTKTESFHANSDVIKIDRYFKLLKEGKNIALVTDAGTPAISDPGALFVAKIREFMEEELKQSGESSALDDNGERISITTIPGPSALAAALSISGLPVADFIFLGFLPHKKGRETLFKEIAAADRAVVFYESPHRIIKTLESLKKHFEVEGEEENEGKSVPKTVVLARELTKIYEEVLKGTPSELLSILESKPEKVRGEFVVIVSPF